MKSSQRHGVKILDSGSESGWDDFVASREDASVYHLSVWKKIIEETFGHRTYYIYSEGDGGIKGILPIVHIKSRLFGNYMVSMPYFNYGGICALDRATEEALLAKAVETARTCGASHMELRETVKRDNGLAVKTSKVCMLLDLPDDADKLWKALPSKLRSQIRRPMKEGMEVRSGGIELLEDFYYVFMTNMRDLGTPVYSKKFFYNILSSLPEGSWLSVVYHEGCPVAVGFCTGFRTKAEIPWASSLRKFNKLSPNMLLYWGVLEGSIKRGYGSFDFGRSSPDSGTYRFKKQWGARPLPLYWHYWLRSGGTMPELNPSNPKYKMFINVWKNLPLWVTRLMGPGIVKNLP